MISLLILVLFISPLLAIMPLNHVLRKCTSGCKFTKSKEKINHMDDIELFAKKKKKMKKNCGLQAIRIYEWNLA